MLLLLIASFLFLLDGAWENFTELDRLRLAAALAVAVVLLLVVVVDGVVVESVVVLVRGVDGQEEVTACEEKEEE